MKVYRLSPVSLRGAAVLRIRLMLLSAVLPYGETDQEADSQKGGAQTGEIDSCGEECYRRVTAYTQKDKQYQHGGAEDDICRIPVFTDFCMYGA